MVNKFRGGFLRFVAEWGISSQHVILLSVYCYTLSVKQWANSSYNHNIQENMIGEELEGRHFGQTKENSQRLWWEGFWPFWSRGQGAQGLVHLWSLRVQSFKFKSRLSSHLKLYLSQQKDKTSFNDLLPWSVLSKYSEVYQVGLSYAFAPHLNTVRSWLQRVVLFYFFLFFIIIFFICSEFCHTLKWKGLGFTCLPHPDPPSHLPPHPLMCHILVYYL